MRLQNSSYFISASICNHGKEGRLSCTYVHVFASVNAEILPWSAGLCMLLLRRLILHAKVATCRFCKFSWISVAIMHLASSFCTRYVCVICGSTSQSPFRVFRSPTSATTTADVVFSSTYISSVEKIKPDYNVAIPAWHEWIFITLFQVHITMYYLTILCVISETIHAGTSGPACQSYLHLDTASKPGDVVP